jgi:hypothetical protein
MRTSEAFPSKHLKSDDILRDTTVTIESVEMKTVGQGEEQEVKPVISFKELEKGLVLNVTNSMVIESMYGDEMDLWPGHRITLYVTKVQYGKKMVPAIRVREGQPAGNGAPAATTDHAAELKTALNIAWAEFQIANPGKSKEEVTPLWKKAIHSYFDGKPAQVLGSDQWKEFVRDKFVKKPIENPIEDAPVFDDSEIPF